MKADARFGYSLLAAVCGALLPGCFHDQAPETVDPGMSSAAMGMSVPADFLATDYEPLRRWLNKRFEVEYRNMTPELIFEQEPIADLRYETRALPRDAPLFHLRSASISRREILFRVAEFWNLDMSIQTGSPSYVLVTGRSADGAR